MTYQGGHYDPPPLDASSGFTPLDLQGLRPKPDGISTKLMSEQ